MPAGKNAKKASRVVKSASPKRGIRSGKQTPSVINGVSKKWAKLLAEDRMPEQIPGQDRKKNISTKIVDHRTQHERDFDRVVFCAPVRRLKDKTQVFPLDMHDGVRTRLTHSMEVSNLARSMGVAVAAKLDGLKDVRDAARNVPSLLAAISLTHDLGNPPFGHQGEEAIREWVRTNQESIRAQSIERFA